ncbi:MAG: hypothetical protein PUG73_04575 [Pseudomonadota bacterium]|nr:hypothetical protein [Pseudomonadota bacterium]
MLKKLAFCFMILLSATIILTAVLTLYFRSEQGKKPFTELLSQAVSLPVSIEHISYNPVHPGKVTVSGLRIGSVFTAEEVYAEVDGKALLKGDIIVRQFDAVNAELDLTSPDAKSLLKPKIRSLSLQEGRVRNLNVTGEDFRLYSVVAEVSGYSPIKDGEASYYSPLYTLFHAKHLDYRGRHIGSTDFSARIDKKGRFIIDDFISHLGKGTLRLYAEVIPEKKLIFLKNSEIDNAVVHVERNILRKLGLTDWHLKSYDIILNRSTLVLRDYNLYLNGVDGGISSITADRGGITEMNAMLNASEISYLGSSLTGASLRLSKYDFWVFDVTGDIYEGRMKASGASDGNTLEFRNLELDSVRPSLAMEPEMLLSNLPFSRYVLKHAVIRGATLLPLDEEFPLYAKDIRMFISDLAWSSHGGFEYQQGSRISVEGAEAAIWMVDLRSFSVTGEVKSHAFDLNLYGFMNGGRVSANVHEHRRARKTDINVVVNRSDANILQLTGISRSATGTISGEAKLHWDWNAAKGEELSGNVTLVGTDLYISDFSLNSMLKIKERTPLLDLYSKALTAGQRTMLNSSKANVEISGSRLRINGQLGLITETLDVELAGRPGSSECRGTVTGSKSGKFLISADGSGKLFAEPEKKPEDKAEKPQEASAAPAADARAGSDEGAARKAPAPASDRAKEKAAEKSPADKKAGAETKHAQKTPLKEAPGEKTKELPGKAPAVIPEGAL